MFIKQRYHFHAAHRNTQLINDKCFSLHGHTYQVEFVMGVKRQGSAGITISFQELHRLIQPVIDHLDHSLLLDVNDSMVESITAEQMKVNIFRFPTSAENLCYHLFAAVINRLADEGLPGVDQRGGYTGVWLDKILLQETTSSVIEYDGGDYATDNAKFFP